MSTPEQTELEQLRVDNVRLRSLLLLYGGWTYFREEDPDHPLGVIAPSGRRRGNPPGKYVEICRLCGEYRADGHLYDCPIHEALRAPGRRLFAAMKEAEREACTSRQGER